MRKLSNDRPLGNRPALRLVDGSEATDAAARIARAQREAQLIALLEAVLGELRRFRQRVA